MGTNGQTSVGANVSFTKFVFILPQQDDSAFQLKIRSVGAAVVRGFFNDFDADGARDPQPRETIQFLLADTVVPGKTIASARYALQLCANYRPRLEETIVDLTRRLNGSASMITMDGAERAPRYTSTEMHNYAYKPAPVRLSGRLAPNAIILPMSKTKAWWDKTSLERHAYFYPQPKPGGGTIDGHARAAEAGISTIHRRLFHNPDGYQRKDEYDFVTYFECTDEHVPVFERIRSALRNPQQNPEWEYVVEGPEWRGRRVIRW